MRDESGEARQNLLDFFAAQGWSLQSGAKNGKARDRVADDLYAARSPLTGGQNNLTRLNANLERVAGANAQAAAQRSG